MNCKHCGQPEVDHWGIKRHCVGKRGLALTIQATTYEPASPVAQPAETSASTGEQPPREGCLQGCFVDTLSSPNHWIEHAEGCPNNQPEHIATTIYNHEKQTVRVERPAPPAVMAQSGAGGPCEDCLWHGCEGPKGGCGCKCHKRPSSPSGQAAATMPETHTPSDEQFWQFMEENAEIVKRWPGWKRIAAGLSAASPTGGAEPPRCPKCAAGIPHEWQFCTPPEPAAAEPSAEQWLQANGYKELGQPIHYEHDGHVGYKYPQEILRAYAAHVTKGLRDALKYECEQKVIAIEESLKQSERADAADGQLAELTIANTESVRQSTEAHGAFEEVSAQLATAREAAVNAVDTGEANWRKGDCLENGCACWTEHVKAAIMASLAPAVTGKPKHQ